MRKEFENQINSTVTEFTEKLNSKNAKKDEEPEPEEQSEPTQNTLVQFENCLEKMFV